LVDHGCTSGYFAGLACDAPVTIARKSRPDKAPAAMRDGGT
jgi:hypothetical protein